MNEENSSEIDRIISANDPVNKLKRQLEVERKVASDDGKFVVQYDWGTLATKEKCAIDGLEIEESAKRNGATNFTNFVYYSLYGKFNGSTILIKISQTPNLSKAAEFLFFDIKGSTNKFDIPYIPSQVDLGIISLQDSQTNPTQNYLWVYKNIFFDVSGTDAESVLALSKSLQKLAEKHLAPITN